MYQVDISVQDFDGVKLLPGGSNWDWTTDHTGPMAGEKRPGDMFCKTFQAWEALVKAAGKTSRQPLTEPMRYDLIDLGRDILARLTTPISQEFVASLGNGTTTFVNATECESTGKGYIELLMDLDTLLGTDTAFLLGSWIEMARAFAAPGDDDCVLKDTACSECVVTNCPDFYEYNAKIQLTSWAGGYGQFTRNLLLLLIHWTCC